MCASEPIARSSIRSEDSQTRAIARTAAMMLSEPKPVRIALRSFPPRPRRQVGPLLQVGAHAASLREALGHCSIDEEDVAARAADRQHVIDGSQQLAIDTVLLRILLAVKPLPKLLA
eukprot:3912234-Pleurochrysis_carterae.AAC.2